MMKNVYDFDDVMIIPKESNIKLLYSVPYYPETNSIEEYFSQLKHYIKKESPNTYEDISN
jgi:hypothetical protein